MIREIGEICRNTHRGIPDCTCRIVFLMHDHPILPIFRNPGRLLATVGRKVEWGIREKSFGVKCSPGKIVKTRGGIVE